MSPPPPKRASRSDAAAVWLLIAELVLDNERRREVADATGVSFGRAKAVRVIARQPVSMSELAEALGIDRPNATVVVDDLEKLGLVRRGPHPSDRRAKLVEATAKGKQLARRADEILATPPPGFGSLDPEDLAELLRILAKVKAPAARS